MYSNYRGGSTDIGDGYTQVVVDMIDSPADDNLNNGFNTGTDNVEGYTIQQIETTLLPSQEWNEWRDVIIQQINNPTNANLPALFAAWQ